MKGCSANWFSWKKMNPHNDDRWDCVMLGSIDATAAGSAPRSMRNASSTRSCGERKNAMDKLLNWPELPGNQQLINMILAGVRVGQQTPDPIRKYVEQGCLVTDDGRFVVMMRPTASARLGTATVMDAKAFRSKASEIRKAIAAMEPDMGTPHMALLINSMYSDERKDDSYQRLQYLRLWQSLAEMAETCLGYQGNAREDNVVVAGKKTLRELTGYRDDIAHWWTDTIDENFQADLQRTINELMRCRYF